MVSGVPIPQIQFSSWDNSELSDPVGTRHQVSGSFAYDKLVGVGCTLAMSFNNLVLNAGENEPYASSDVAVVNVSIPNFGTLQNSGLSTVYNFRLWVPTGSGSIIDTPGSHLEFFTSGVWVPNVDFPSGHGQQFMRTLPTQFNLRRIDGNAELISYNDSQVSEYIYMRLFLDARFPLGTYGVCGSGLLRPRLTFDFY